jgi:hypothetical protein
VVFFFGVEERDALLIYIMFIVDKSLPIWWRLLWSHHKSLRQSLEFISIVCFIWSFCQNHEHGGD